MRPHYLTGTAEIARASITDAQPSHRTFSPNSTALYSLVDRSEVAHNPKIDELRNLFEKLEHAGLVSADEVKGLRVRLVGLSPENRTTPEGRVKEEALFNTPGQRHLDDKPESLKVGSVMEPAFNTLTISEAQGREIYEGRQFAMGKTELIFLHELGHAIHGIDNNAMLHTLTEEAKGLRGVEADSYANSKLEGFSNAVSSQIWGLPDVDLLATTYNSKQRFVATGHESFGDAFEVVAVHALHGKEAALKVVNAEISIRNLELVSHCQDVHLEGKPLVEGHHTVHALTALRDKILSGEVEQALREGTSRELIYSSVAEGIAGEYRMLQAEKLNPHHITTDGVKPGLPEFMSVEAFSQFADQHDRKVGALLIVPLDLMQKMNERGMLLFEECTERNEFGAPTTQLRPLEPFIPDEPSAFSAEDKTQKPLTSNYALLPMGGTKLQVMEPGGKMTPIELDSGLQNLVNNLLASENIPATLRLDELREGVAQARTPQPGESEASAEKPAQQRATERETQAEAELM